MQAPTFAKMGGARGLLLSLMALGTPCADSRHAHNPDSVKLYVRNEADVGLDISWINTFQRNALVKQREKPIQPYTSMNIDSYKTHSFLLVDSSIDLDTYNATAHDPKIMVNFTMSQYDEEVVVTRKSDGDLTAKVENSLTKTMKLMGKARETCMESVCAAKRSCPNEAVMASSPEFQACVANEVAIVHANVERDLSRTLKLLEEVGDRSRNYTCADVNMTTTEETVREYKWDAGAYRAASKPRHLPVKVFLEEPSAKIMVIDDFVTEEECTQLMRRAESTGLTKASVNSDDGGSTLSPARRAMAGAVDPDLSNRKDPVTQLFERGFAFAEDVTGYGMALEGQEGFSVIKYDPTDEYRPHCDGDCTGVAYKPGGRVCTMVVYCEAPKYGGATTFSSADVYVKGQPGQASFFSYYHKEKNITDVGLTRHSGCPIIEGNKWIATLWMRLGVDAATHWTRYDPEGNVVSEMKKRSKITKAASGSSGGDDDEEGMSYEEDDPAASV